MDPKRAAGEKAVEYVSEGMVIGLGTGLFINTCEKIIIGSEDGVRIVENNAIITY